MSELKVEPITCLAPTRRRLDVSPEVTRGYWLDVHGPVVANLPGLYTYWQFHLDHDRGGNWPRISGIANAIDDDDQLDGLAEIGWANDDEKARYFRAAEEADIQADEPVLFRMVMVQLTLQGGTRTFKDLTSGRRPNGDDPDFRLFLAIRRRPDIAPSAFRETLLTEFAPALADSADTSKVRLSLMQDFQETDWGTDAVDNAIPVDRQYQAYIELVLPDRVALRRLYGSEPFSSVASKLAAVSHHVNAFRVRETFAYVAQGDVTPVGRFGAHRARMISETGSTYMIDRGTSTTGY